MKYIVLVLALFSVQSYAEKITVQCRGNGGYNYETYEPQEVKHASTNYHGTTVELKDGTVLEFSTAYSCLITRESKTTNEK